MAKKKTQSETKKLVQELVAKKSIIIGTDRTLKALRKGEVKRIFLSANCPGTARSQIARYCMLSKLEMQELPMQSNQLGALCKKPFSISVFGVRKE
jgi:large subunit ribosomal protein L30e